MKLDDFKGKLNTQRIVFINPNLSGGATIRRQQPPLGLMSLMGALRQIGVTYNLIDAEGYCLSDDQVLEEVKRLAPDFIGVPLFTLSSHYIFPLLHLIKKNSDVKIISGGPLPTVDAKWVMHECTAIDYCILGEGEVILPALLDAIIEGRPVETVPNIVYRSAETVVEQERKPIYLEGHEVPMPDFDVIDFKQYGGVNPIGAWPSINLLVTRGCPFKCTFCSNPIWNHGPHAVPVSTVIDWLKILASKGIKEVFFVDDTLNINEKWFDELCSSLIDTKLNQLMTFKGPFRANLTSLKQLQRAKEAGFWLIFYGVESGCQELLDYYRKAETVEDMTKAIFWTREAGLKSQASMIAGAPLDTSETLLQTSNFLRIADPDYAPTYPLIPYVGTAISMDILQRGILTEYDIRNYDMEHPIIRTDTMNTKDLLDIISFMRKDFCLYKHSAARRVRRIKEIREQEDDITQCNLILATEEKEADAAYANGGVPIFHEVIPGSAETCFYGEHLDANSGDYRFQFGGWFAIEEKKFRWTNQTVKIPFYLPKPVNELIIIWNSFRNIPVKVDALLNENIVAQVDINQAGWKSEQIFLETESCGEIWLELRIINTWNPPNDSRTLGVAIQKIYFETNHQNRIELSHV